MSSKIPLIYNLKLMKLIELTAFAYKSHFIGCFPGDSDGEEYTGNAGDLSLIHGSGRSPGEGMATHSTILAQRIPWTEESGGL